tara:strand:- start:937 stop:1224 length:288 start_codon:yes stop_codon:yes gene_type:complete
LGRLKDGRCAWCNKFFFVYRRELNERFGQLFKGSGESNIIAKKWGWYAIIYNLAGGDPLKIEDATQIEIESAFTYLAYEQDLNRQGKSPDADQYR